MTDCQIAKFTAVGPSL